MCGQQNGVAGSDRRGSGSIVGNPELIAQVLINAVAGEVESARSSVSGNATFEEGIWAAGLYDLLRPHLSGVDSLFSAIVLTVGHNTASHI